VEQYPAAVLESARFGSLNVEESAELRSAWTLRLRSGQAHEGARPHTNPSPHEPQPLGEASL